MDSVHTPLTPQSQEPLFHDAAEYDQCPHLHKTGQNFPLVAPLREKEGEEEEEEGKRATHVPQKMVKEKQKISSPRFLCLSLLNVRKLLEGGGRPWGRPTSLPPV